jgi:hypothetical protein
MKITAIWIFQRSNVLKTCKEIETILHRMLIYKIIRYIIMIYPFWNRSLSRRFPSGNWYIDVLLAWRDHEFAEARRFKLDSEAPTKVSLTTTFRVEAQVF